MAPLCGVVAPLPRLLLSSRPAYARGGEAALAAYSLLERAAATVQLLLDGSLTSAVAILASGFLVAGIWVAFFALVGSSATGSPTVHAVAQWLDLAPARAAHGIRLGLLTVLIVAEALLAAVLFGEPASADTAIIAIVVAFVVTVRAGQQQNP